MRPVFFALLSLLVFLSCENSPVKKRVLPILGNYDLEYTTVDGEKNVDTLYHKIREFKFLDEDSVWKTNKDFKNKLWIAEFFFATCPTVCPAMNLQLKKLNQELKAYENDVQFLSFTINPKHDTPSVLKQYMDRKSLAHATTAFISLF